MAKHVLSFEAPDTMNDCILRLVDTSVYNPDSPVTCPLLEVTLPGFQNPVQFPEAVLQPGFIKNYTACDLEVQTENCGTRFNALPDGIYILKYSVSPKEYVYVEYNHLRMTKALIRYSKVLCELNIGACTPDAILEKKLRDLRLIRTYFDAAKAMVEICHHPQRGMEIFKYANKLLSKFDCRSCR